MELHGLDTAERVCFYEQDFYVLSNFSAFQIMWNGIKFPTLEHAYHSQVQGAIRQDRAGRNLAAMASARLGYGEGWRHAVPTEYQSLSARICPPQAVGNRRTRASRK